MAEVIEMYQGIPSDWVYHRGDIYIANLNPYTGAEQGGIRPVVVLQNNIGNLHSPTLIVAAMTKEIKRTDLPTHVYIRPAGNLKKPSIIVLEQIHAIDKMRILRYLGKISKDQMSAVEDAALESLGMPIPECVDAP